MKRPDIPDVPACHGWPLPPFPQRCDSGVMMEWQAGRCAICADTRPLELDHDHDSPTGDVRGYLCQRCNLSEGQRWADRYSAFDLYRKRNPASILGVVERYRGAAHPLLTSTHDAFIDALNDHWDLTHGTNRHATIRALGSVGPEWDAVLGPVDQPKWTPLAQALLRVGLDREEWRATVERRAELARRQTVHAPTETDPPRNLCQPDRPWMILRDNGPLLRPCPDCFVLDRERVMAMVGPDGQGSGPPDFEAQRIREANRWRRKPTPPPAFIPGRA